MSEIVPFMSTGISVTRAERTAAESTNTWVEPTDEQLASIENGGLEALRTFDKHDFTPRRTGNTALEGADVTTHPVTIKQGNGAKKSDWRKKAACLGVDSNVFYPEYRGDTCDKAKAICAKCVVRKPCLEDNLDTFSSSDDHGVRGGLNKDERDDIRRKRNRSEQRNRRPTNRASRKLK